MFDCSVIVSLDNRDILEEFEEQRMRNPNKRRNQLSQNIYTGFNQQKFLTFCFDKNYY